MGLIERCAQALWEQECGKKFREHYPWDSDDPTAKAARNRAKRRAEVVLDAANHQGAVEDREALAGALDSAAAALDVAGYKTSAEQARAVLNRHGGR